MKTISENDFVQPLHIKTFSEVDGFFVIRQLLKFKGSEVVKTNTVPFKQLEEMALIVYGLKSNSTNRLYVAAYLNKFYRKASLLYPHDSNHIMIPSGILSEIKKEEESFRK